jgi:hypothetical protein
MPPSACKSNQIENDVQKSSSKHIKIWSNFKNQPQKKTPTTGFPHVI